MTQRGLDNLKSAYDVVVIGGGLGGLTAANRLASFGRSVLLLEHHTMLGGLATWFKRKGYIFDVALHGFPVGMKKTCRKYWSRELYDRIVPLRNIRFDNPQFSLTTTFDEQDFTRLLIEKFGVAPETVAAFFAEMRSMNYYDDQTATTRELFDRYFPGRDDVVRFLMEPITYANGSTLDEPAITYGIVFSNFMSQGVYTFEGGTDKMLELMQADLARNGADVRTGALVEKIVVEPEAPAPGAARPKVRGVVANGRFIPAAAVLSNANLLTTIRDMVGAGHFAPEFLRDAQAVRINNSSCQVYIAIRRGETIENIGDLLFTSTAPRFDPKAMLDRRITSRTFSVYYPYTRPGLEQHTVVASSNANYEDWAGLSREEYAAAKAALIEGTLDALEKYLPDVRRKIGHVEAATPRTFERYTRHVRGASFGTKFEGLRISMGLKDRIGGLFHAGSVGIIMSGWLGAANYGAIVANDVDRYLDGAPVGGAEAAGARGDGDV
jgi:phytoene dehydrogenase-like protein